MVFIRVRYRAEPSEASDPGGFNDEVRLGLWCGWIHRWPSDQTVKARGLLGTGVDLKFHDSSDTGADDFVVGDLRDQGSAAP